MINLHFLIQHYFNNWDGVSRCERYKWLAFKHFKDNCYKDYANIGEWVNAVFSKTDNLLSSKQYLPLGMIKEFATTDGEPIALKNLFSTLLQEDSLPTDYRVRDFIAGAKSIMLTMADRGYGNWKGRKNLNSYQDVRAVSVYLSLFYPNDFYIYKFNIFKEFARQVNYTIRSKNAVDRLFEYQRLCNDVKVELIKNTELINFYKGWLKSSGYEDNNFNLLTQDFIYAIAVHLNSDTYSKIKGKKSRVKTLNIISTNDLQSPIISNKHSFVGVKGIAYDKIDRQNKMNGNFGELWAINFEKDRLRELNIDTDLVRHAAKEDGDGCGYDIKSVENDGKTPRYIEVKTTTGDETQLIYFTDNELAFSMHNKEHYYIYRVYNFESADDAANLTIIEKTGLDEINAEPVKYRAIISHK